MGNAVIVGRLIVVRVRSQAQYRISFCLELVASFGATLINLFAILFLFQTFPTLGGWSIGEVFFLYGLISVAFGLSQIIGAGFDTVPSLVRSGDFDRLLTRPVPPFLQVMATDIQTRRLGWVAQGVLGLSLAQRKLTLDWSASRLLVTLTAIGSSPMVFLTILVIGASLCFWSVEPTEIQNVFTYGGSEMTSYPIHIYERWLRDIFLYAIPLGLTSFYPALYVLHRPDPLGLPSIAPFVSPVVAAAFFAAGLWVWSSGMRHYQGTGN